MSPAETQPLYKECGPFAVIPVWLLFHPKATDRAVRLYNVLWSYTDDENRIAWPSRKTLGERMGCGRKKVDQAIDELVKIGGITITPRVRPGTTERTSNIYELIRAERTAPFCRTCGHAKVGCKCSLRREQMDTTWGANGYQGGVQMDTAEVEPSEEEPANKNHLPLSHTSQAKMSREDKIRKSKNLPCDAETVLDCMRQMSLECYAKPLRDISAAKFNEIKTIVVDLCDTMLRNNKKVDRFPVYIHGFAAWYNYNIENHTNYDHPAPKSYANAWDDVDWREDWLRKEMTEWLTLEAEEPETPHTASWASCNGNGDNYSWIDAYGNKVYQ